MKSPETLAPLAAAALLAGGGAHTGRILEQLPEQHAPVTRIQTNPENKWAHDMQTALNNYRNGVLLRHQARLALGLCVAWGTNLPDGRDGTTITLNPGIMESEGQEYLIFSTHNPFYNPSWGPLNGPSLDSQQADIIIMTKNPVIDAKTERKLSSTQSNDKFNPQAYYKDLSSGQPAIDTIILPGKVTSKGLERVCLELKEGKKISSKLNSPTA